MNIFDSGIFWTALGSIGGLIAAVVTLLQYLENKNKKNKRGKVKAESLPAKQSNNWPPFVKKVIYFVHYNMTRKLLLYLSIICVLLIIISLGIHQFQRKIIYVDQIKLKALLEQGNAREVVWSPDGKWLGIAGYYIYIYDAKTFKQIKVIDKGASSIAFSPDSTRLALGQSVGSIIILKVEGWGEPQTLTDSENASSVAFSPDGETLAATVDQVVKRWDVSSGKVIDTIPIGSTQSNVIFSPDGKLLAVAGGQAGGDIKLLETKTGTVLHVLTGHTNWIKNLAFSPDGTSLASACVDKDVKLWDVAKGIELRTLSGHEGYVESVAFSPDGKLLASVSWDLTVKLWNVAHGQELRSLTGHSDRILSVAFSPDGSLLASGGEDNHVRIWEIPNK